MRAGNRLDFVVFVGMKRPFLSRPGIGELRVREFDLEIDACWLSVFQTEGKGIAFTYTKLERKAAQVEILHGFGFGSRLENVAVGLANFFVGESFDVSQQRQKLQLLGWKW